MSSLWLHETTPTPGHCLLILAEPPNLMGSTRFAITACAHKVHSWDAAVHGRWPPPKVANWCSLCTHRSHTSVMMKARNCTPSNPATRGWHPLVHPRVYILAQGSRRKTVQLCMGIGLHPKSRIGAVYVYTEATQVLR